MIWDDDRIALLRILIRADKVPNWESIGKAMGMSVDIVRRNALRFGIISTAHGHLDDDDEAVFDTSTAAERATHRQTLIDASAQFLTLLSSAHPERLRYLMSTESCAYEPRF